jgi:hypothetical protein
MEAAEAARPSMGERLSSVRPSQDRKRKGCLHPMASTPSMEVPSELGSNPQTDADAGGQPGPKKAPSWETHFRNKSTRQELSVSCADALTAMLLDNKRVVKTCGSPVGLGDRVRVALSRAFDFLARPGCLIASSTSSGGTQTTDGCVVGVAVEELLRTSEAAGFICQRVIGPDLQAALTEHHGEQASMAKAEACWGLAALVEQLESRMPGSRQAPDGHHLTWAQSERVRRMLEEWAAEFGLERTLSGDDTMFSLVLESVGRAEDPISNPTLSPALWMMSPSEEGRCPDPLEAFKAHARIASLLAEGVLLAFEAWNDENDASRQSSPDGSPDGSEPAATGATLALPAWFGSPLAMHLNWIGWKMNNQGQEKAQRSTYIASRGSPVRRRTRSDSTS